VLTRIVDPIRVENKVEYTDKEENDTVEVVSVFTIRLENRMASILKDDTDIVDVCIVDPSRVENRP